MKGLFSALVALTFCLFGCPEPSTDWDRRLLSEAGDPSDNVGMNSSIAVDPTGRIHISYQEYTVGKYWTRYLKREGTDWSSWAYVDESSATAGPGTRIAVGNSKVYVSSVLKGDDCSDSESIDCLPDPFSPTGDLVLSSRNLDEPVPELPVWPNQASSVLDERSNGEWTSLLIEPSGRRHLAYYDSSNHGRIRYKKKEVNGDWTTETVAEPGCVFGCFPKIKPYTAMTFGDNAVHLLYKDEYRASNFSTDLTQRIRYAKRSPDVGVWTKTTVVEAEDEEHEFGEKMDITIDSGGVLHICYFDKTARVMRYVKKNENSFSSPVALANFSFDVLDGCEIEVLGQKVFIIGRANPKLNANEELEPVLVVASRGLNSTGSWSFGIVDSGESVFGFGSNQKRTFSATVVSDRLHLAYEVCGAGGCEETDLKYACYPAPCLLETDPTPLMTPDSSTPSVDQPVVEAVLETTDLSDGEENSLSDEDLTPEESAASIEELPEPTPSSSAAPKEGIPGVNVETVSLGGCSLVR